MEPKYLFLRDFARMCCGASVFVAVLAGFPSPGRALTAQGDVDLGQEATLAAAKRYVVTHFLKAGGDVSDVLRLEDPTAGLLRIVYRDDKFVDENTLIEVIDSDADHCRVKVTVPGDFGGRAELLLQKIRAAATQQADMKGGTPLFYDPKKVYRSVLRHILRDYVAAKQKKEDVIRAALEDVGLIRFVYRRGTQSDPDASVVVLPEGKGGSRLIVDLPRLSADRRILLESDLLASVKSDLGEGVPKEAETEAD